MPVIVRSGPLRQTAQLIVPTETADTYGEPDITWTTDTVVHRAEVMPLFGDERLAIYQITPETTHAVRMRYLSTLAPKYRILIDETRIFEVVGVLDTELRVREMMVACKDLGEVEDETEEFEVEIIATKDNDIEGFSSRQSTNNGTDTSFYVGNNSTNTNPLRVLLHFDLSSIPSGATITDAVLEMYNTHASSAALDAHVYRLTQTDWNESQSSWNNYKTGSPWTVSEGQNPALDPEGGDYTTVGGVAWALSTDSAVWVEIEGLQALAHDAYTARSDQLHLLLKIDDEAQTNNQRFNLFRSIQYADSAFHPRLRVTYEV